MARPSPISGLMIVGWLFVGLGMVIAALVVSFGPPPNFQQVTPVANGRVVERASSPETIADLHRREREFFDKQYLGTQAVPEQTRVVDVEWEPVRAPDGKQLHRTKIPGGWLVLYADTAVIVTDIEHAWGANR